MKPKLITTLMIALGVFLFVGVVSASDTETLQPAATITYNEDVDVNGTLYTNSAYIGETGVGGVTFFNGSIVNVGATTPVTIADDLRVDGEIWRGSKGGDPIKISDSVLPTLTNVNNLGASSHRWKQLYVNDGIFYGFAKVDGPLFANNDINVYGNIYNTQDDYVKFTDPIKPGWAIDAACDSSMEGAIRYSSGNKKFSGCDGTNWIDFY